MFTRKAAVSFNCAQAVQWAAYDALEPRVLFAAVFPTVAEQYMLYLLNQSRANPQATVTQLANNAGWKGATPDLNEGLPAGTITNDPKQPLAFNPFLIDASQKHSQWMLDNQLFQHDEGTAAAPIGFAARDTAAGYVFGAGSGGENIAYSGTPGTPDQNAVVVQQENDLFIDSGIDGRGHRTNLMNPGYNEIGIGTRTGTYQGSNAVMTTQDFANAGNGSFVTGIAYNDANQNNAFDPNEGLGAVTITATRTGDNQVFTTTTWAAGGYSLALTPGTYQVAATGGNVGLPAPRTVTIGTINVEADFKQTVVQPAQPTAPTITTQPTSQTVAIGNPVTFAVVATGNPLPTVQWQVSSNGGAYTNIAGATGQVYTYTPAVGDGGNSFQAVLTNSQGTVTSTPATLTISGLPLNITVSPLSQQVNAGDTVTFAAAATGSGVTTQWQVSTDGGNTYTNIPGATSGTYTFVATPDLSGANYQVVFADSAGAGASAVASLTVNAAPAAPVINAQPVNTNATVGNAVLAVAANGFPAPTVQWQIQTPANGAAPAIARVAHLKGGFSNIQGATGSSVTLPVPRKGVYHYRAVITNANGSVTTRIVTVTANTKSPVANDLTTLHNAIRAALAAITTCRKATAALVARLSADLRRLRATKAQRALVATLASNESAARQRFLKHQSADFAALTHAAAVVTADSAKLKKDPGSTTLQAKLQTDLAALQAAAAASTAPADASQCKFATDTQLIPIAAIAPTDARLQTDVESGNAGAETIGQALQAPVTIALSIVTQLAKDAQGS